MTRRLTRLRPSRRRYWVALALAGAGVFLATDPALLAWVLGLVMVFGAGLVVPTPKEFDKPLKIERG